MGLNKYFITEKERIFGQIRDEYIQDIYGVIPVDDEGQPQTTSLLHIMYTPFVIYKEGLGPIRKTPRRLIFVIQVRTPVKITT